PHAAGGVGHDQGVDAELREDAHRERRGGGVVSFVEMEAATLGHDRGAGEGAGHQFALVALDGGRGKAGDLRVGNPDRVPDPVGEPAEPGAEHDRHRGPARAEPRPHRLRGPGYLLRPPAFDLRPAHNSIPAMLALVNAARLPATIALSPSRAISPFRSGASPP